MSKKAAFSLLIGLPPLCSLPRSRFVRIEIWDNKEMRDEVREAMLTEVVLSKLSYEKLAKFECFLRPFANFLQDT